MEELGDQELGHKNNMQNININNPLHLNIIQLIKRTHGTNACVENQEADV